MFMDVLNSILDCHLSITSPVSGTTRNIIQGIYNDEKSQIVFVDTPGIHKPNHKLGKYLNREAYYSIDDVDVILFLTDASQALGNGDKYVIDKSQCISCGTCAGVCPVGAPNEDEE